MGIISEKVRAERRRLEISQVDMADRVDISRERYIAFEKGRGKYSEEEFERIVKAVGVKIEIVKSE